MTATLLRGVVLAGIPLAMALGRIDLTWAMACHRAEALILGYVDTSVHTVPLELAGHRADLLYRVNSRYELAFEVGAVAGLKYLVTHWYLLVIVVGLMLFHLYDLRKVLSAFFAKGLLRQASSAGQVGAGFALGGVVGALLYAVSRHRGRGAGWVLGGVAGTVLLALGWIPVNVPTMIVAVFLFGVTNVGARLVLTRWRQELTPLDHAGGVRAASEFGRTAMSVGVDSLVGGAFRRDSAPTAPSGSSPACWYSSPPPNWRSHGTWPGFRRPTPCRHLSGGAGGYPGESPRPCRCQCDGRDRRWSCGSGKANICSFAWQRTSRLTVVAPAVDAASA